MLRKKQGCIYMDIEEKMDQNEPAVLQNHKKSAYHPDMEIASELVPDVFSTEERTNAHTKWVRNFETNRLHTDDSDRK